MTYYNRKELAEVGGCTYDEVRRLEESGTVKAAIRHGSGKGTGSIILYDQNSLAQLKAALAKSAPVEPVKEKAPPAPPRPIVNVPLDDLLDILTSIRRDGQLEMEYNRNRQAELLASLRTIAEEIRALRAVWESK